MGKGGSTKSETNTVSEPWSEAQPYLKGLLEDTQSAYGSGAFDIAPYQGPRVAPQGALTQTALDQVTNMVNQPNDFIGAAKTAFNDMMLGDTYAKLDELKASVLSDAIPAATAAFQNSGMLDSSMAADTVGRAAASAIAPIEYGAYNDMQNRKVAGLDMAPRLVAGEYLPATTAITTGQYQDAYNQSVLDAEMAKYYEGANQPYDEIARAANLMMGFGGLGGTSTSQGTQPSGSSPMGSALQGVGGLGLLYSSIFGPQ